MFLPLPQRRRKSPEISKQHLPCRLFEEPTEVGTAWLGCPNTHAVLTWTACSNFHYIYRDNILSIQLRHVPHTEKMPSSWNHEDSLKIKECRGIKWRISSAVTWLFESSGRTKRKRNRWSVGGGSREFRNCHVRLFFHVVWPVFALSPPLASAFTSSLYGLAMRRGQSTSSNA